MQHEKKIGNFSCSCCTIFSCTPLQSPLKTNILCDKCQTCLIILFNQNGWESCRKKMHTFPYNFNHALSLSCLAALNYCFCVMGCYSITGYRFKHFVWSPWQLASQAQSQALFVVEERDPGWGWTYIKGSAVLGFIVKWNQYLTNIISLSLSYL